jgi:hypothetical protein
VNDSEPWNTVDTEVNPPWRAVLCRRRAVGTFLTTEHTEHTEENKQPFSTTKNTKEHERKLIPKAVDFFSCGKIIHRRRCSVVVPSL